MFEQKGQEIQNEYEEAKQMGNALMGGHKRAAKKRAAASPGVGA